MYGPGTAPLLHPQGGYAGGRTHAPSKSRRPPDTCPSNRCMVMTIMASGIIVAAISLAIVIGLAVGAFTVMPTMLADMTYMKEKIKQAEEGFYLFAENSGVLEDPGRYVQHADDVMVTTARIMERVLEISELAKVESLADRLDGTLQSVFDAINLDHDEHAHDDDADWDKGEGDLADRIAHTVVRVHRLLRSADDHGVVDTAVATANDARQIMHTVTAANVMPRAKRILIQVEDLLHMVKSKDLVGDAARLLETVLIDAQDLSDLLEGALGKGIVFKMPTSSRREIVIDTAGREAEPAAKAAPNRSRPVKP